MKKAITALFRKYDRKDFVSDGLRGLGERWGCTDTGVVMSTNPRDELPGCQALLYQILPCSHGEAI